MGKKALTIEAINRRLKSARIGLAVIQRGSKLSLRGTLPPKPGSGRSKPYQQTISLGVYANPAGLEYAEAKAYEIGSLVAQHRFSWIGIEKPQSADSCQAWVDAFKEYALTNLISQSGVAADLIWRDRYWYPAFSKLDMDSDLTPDAIIAAIGKTRANSRSRQVCCQRFGKLIEFAGLTLDLKPYRGNYSPKEVEREIPSDEQIVQAIDAMTNVEWQWVAGMMAVYGLRDHECWLCELFTREENGRSVLVCRVFEGKTGSREVVPLPPDWVSRWNLAEGHPPTLNVNQNKQYGDRTGRAFKRQKMPFPPYALRHRWAIRAALDYGFAPSLAAKWMGHDVTTHLSIYQKHISEGQAIAAWFEKTH